jgi:transcriptional regulator with XRE-family HTH domain
MTEVRINGVLYFPKCAELEGDYPFHQVIKTLRESIGYTLDDGAQQIRCSKSYLWGLENQKHVPSFEMVMRISAAYGTSLDALAKAMRKTLNA